MAGVPHKHFGRLAGGNRHWRKAGELPLLPGGGKYGCVMFVIINTMAEEFAVNSSVGGDCV